MTIVEVYFGDYPFEQILLNSDLKWPNILFIIYDIYNHIIIAPYNINTCKESVADCNTKHVEKDKKDLADLIAVKSHPCSL